MSVTQPRLPPRYIPSTNIGVGVKSPFPILTCTSTWALAALPSTHVHPTPPFTTLTTLT